GTFAPALRASDKPIAMACFRLVTRLPERPLRSVPCLRSSIARLTLLWALRPYFAIRVLLKRSPSHSQVRVSRPTDRRRATRRRSPWPVPPRAPFLRWLGRYP